MKCLVCDNNIRINTLKQLSSPQPLLLCAHCSQNLVPKSVNVLYNDNEWIRTVIGKLNQGDIALIQLFKNDLQKALSKKKAIHSNIKIIEAKNDSSGIKTSPYPWLEILVDSIKLASKDRYLGSRTESIIVAVEKQKNISNQVAIVG